MPVSIPAILETQQLAINSCDTMNLDTGDISNTGKSTGAQTDGPSYLAQLDAIDAASETFKTLGDLTQVINPIVAELNNIVSRVNAKLRPYEEKVDRAVQEQGQIASSNGWYSTAISEQESIRDDAQGLVDDAQTVIDGLDENDPNYATDLAAQQSIIDTQTPIVDTAQNLIDTYNEELDTLNGPYATDWEEQRAYHQAVVDNIINTFNTIMAPVRSAFAQAKSAIETSNSNIASGKNTMLDTAADIAKNISKTAGKAVTQAIGDIAENSNIMAPVDEPPVFAFDGNISFRGAKDTEKFLGVEWDGQSVPSNTRLIPQTYNRSVNELRTHGFQFGEPRDVYNRFKIPIPCDGEIFSYELKFDNEYVVGNERIQYFGSSPADKRPSSLAQNGVNLVFWYSDTPGGPPRLGTKGIPYVRQSPGDIEGIIEWVQGYSLTDKMWYDPVNSGRAPYSEYVEGDYLVSPYSNIPFFPIVSRSYFMNWALVGGFDAIKFEEQGKAPSDNERVVIDPLLLGYDNDFSDLSRWPSVAADLNSNSSRSSISDGRNPDYETFNEYVERNRITVEPVTTSGNPADVEDALAVYQDGMVIQYADGTVSEGLKLVKTTKTARAALINGWYTSTLNRPAEKGGLNYWAQRIIDEGDNAAAETAVESEFNTSAQNELALGGVIGVYTLSEWDEGRGAVNLFKNERIVRGAGNNGTFNNIRFDAFIGQYEVVEQPQGCPISIDGNVVFTIVRVLEQELQGYFGISSTWSDNWSEFFLKYLDVNDDRFTGTSRFLPTFQTGTSTPIEYKFRVIGGDIYDPGNNGGIINQNDRFTDEQGRVYYRLIIYHAQDQGYPNSGSIGAETTFGPAVIYNIRNWYFGYFDALDIEGIEYIPWQAAKDNGAWGGTVDMNTIWDETDILISKSSAIEPAGDYHLDYLKPKSIQYVRFAYGNAYRIFFERNADADTRAFTGLIDGNMTVTFGQKKTAEEIAAELALVNAGDPGEGPQPFVALDGVLTYNTSERATADFRAGIYPNERLVRINNFRRSEDVEFGELFIVAGTNWLPVNEWEEAWRERTGTGVDVEDQFNVVNNVQGVRPPPIDTTDLVPAGIPTFTEPGTSKTLFVGDRTIVLGPMNPTTDLISGADAYERATKEHYASIEPFADSVEVLRKEAAAATAGLGGFDATKIQNKKNAIAVETDVKKLVAVAEKNAEEAKFDFVKVTANMLSGAAKSAANSAKSLANAATPLLANARAAIISTCAVAFPQLEALIARQEPPILSDPSPDITSGARITGPYSGDGINRTGGYL